MCVKSEAMLIAVWCYLSEVWILTFAISIITSVFDHSSSKHRWCRSLLKLLDASLFKRFFLLSQWDAWDHFYVWPIWGHIMLLLITVFIVVTGSRSSLVSQCTWELDLKLGARSLLLRGVLLIVIRRACWQQCTGHIFNWIAWVISMVVVVVAIYHWLLPALVVFVAEIDCFGV